MSRSKRFKLKLNWLNLSVILAIILFSFIIWWPTRYLPYHWDSAGFFINAAKTLKENHFIPFITSDSDFAHPPLLVGLQALVWTLFGTARPVTHLTMFPFLPILMISTYFLAKKLTSNITAVISAFLAGFIPVVIAEYGVIYIDLPMASLATAALALYANHQQLSSYIALTLACLTKLPAIYLFPFFYLYHPKPKSQKRINPYLFIPLLSLAAWFFYHYTQTGWWFVRAGRNTNVPQSIDQLINSFTYVSQQVMFAQGRWLLTLISIVSLIGLIRIKNFKLIQHQAFYHLLLTFLIAISIFAIGGEFALRYGIFLFPVFLIISFFLIETAITKFWPKNQSWKLIFVGFIIALTWLLHWHPKLSPTQTYQLRPPSDLGYLDIINIHRQAAVFLELKAPKSHIYGSFPENIYLTQPYQGYVTTPLEFSSCQDFQLEPDKSQLIYAHFYSPQQDVCRNILNQYSFKPIQHFQSNDKWLEIYQITATQSAQPLKEN